MNEFWRIFRAAVVHNDDFETRRVRLPRQRLQTLIKGDPIVANGYNNAEQWCCARVLFVLNHTPSFCRPVNAPMECRIAHSTVKSKLALGYFGYTSRRHQALSGLVPELIGSYDRVVRHLLCSMALFDSV